MTAPLATIRHHQQDHAQIWVTQLAGDKVHVSLSNCGMSTAIVLDAEICAELFARKFAEHHAIAAS
ncbi:hypothetical protein [Novosphingobium sp. GV055]|uniref:hypothetical protein n=1 Tax=unclassified Novosphingobium TaxID=2644732 RepID=UPI000D4D1508|nr:hypothetical protein C8K11_1449 [Novosphingobium sp. GV055]PUA93745.1 hypothetical protein C8K12_1449 [Novosphingobium sp. GV061]PUB10285.1 hypothetical protein C8K14_1469 [Novosphingobium sp. GV079]PUB36448.1 hypothetical protein C8K10_1439 [Novosphingobium sp. GV027]